MWYTTTSQSQQAMYLTGDWLVVVYKACLDWSAACLPSPPCLQDYYLPYCSAAMKPNTGPNTLQRRGSPGAPWVPPLLSSSNL
ncbi:hypothetical protein GDO78_001000 [Eleutherodactylus coqui]|uniref:Uncharacterized protein n=1 Tax=Eleutherodactylus coqui TaxID=57060 RepID=A0A8J6KGA0_ELECQ|nr:hypothetical protein GDO78_001000 [Eleutherodactylus coqui]